jgi:hypothetical protein
LIFVFSLLPSLLRCFPQITLFFATKGATQLQVAPLVAKRPVISPLAVELSSCEMEIAEEMMC